MLMFLPCNAVQRAKFTPRMAPGLGRRNMFHPRSGLWAAGLTTTITTTTMWSHGCSMFNYEHRAWFRMVSRTILRWKDVKKKTCEKAMLGHSTARITMTRSAVSTCDSPLVDTSALPFGTCPRHLQEPHISRTCHGWRLFPTDRLR